MTIKLRKGEKINLSKESRGLAKVIVGLGWDENNNSSNQDEGFFTSLGKLLFGESAMSGDDFDCDAVAIMLENGYYKRREDLVFYNNLVHKSGSVKHMGDNLTGNAAGEKGDAEQILIDLKHVPGKYDRIVLAVGIYQALQRHQHFGMINNTYIRVVDDSTKREICRYNLTDNYPNMTHVIFGDLHKDKNGEWQFRAIGEGTKDDNVVALANRFVS
ncbi:MAG: TerD family protein [Candidatus Riflebacteria bacterium]|nr:TerD family protein [Candidatus Riflebacteria bacterium]